MRFRAFAFTTLALASALVSVPVQAQLPASSASNATEPTPEELFKVGMKASEDQDWPRAYEFLSRAWARKQHWKIAANLGRVELKVGRNCDAVAHIKYFLDGAKDLSAADRKQAESMLDEAKSKVASLAIRVNVEGADVFIDGNPIGRSPLPGAVCVDAGTREIKARRPGYRLASDGIVLRAGALKNVSLSLAAKQTPDRGPDEVERGAKPNKILIYSGITAGATLLVTGSILAIVSQAKSDESDQYRQGREHDNQTVQRNLQDQRVALATASMWNFISAGIVGGGTLAYVLVTSSSRSKNWVQARVYASPTGIGLAGSW